MLKRIIFTCILLFTLDSAALAGGGKTPESCAGVGAALVKCYDCRAKKYLGNVSVLTSYEEDQGKKFCVRASDAKEACSRVYGVSSGCIGFYTKYSLGMGSVEETYNTTCVEAIGY